VLLTKTLTMKWSANNKVWFESKGYTFTKWKDEFEIKVEDLSDGSGALVDVQCDGCGEILTNMKWQSYIRSSKKDGKYYCKKCSCKLFDGENQRKTKLKSSKSFYDWCYENLPRAIANYILSKWDYALNINKNGNIISPKDVSFSSTGFDGKGYWFKCLKYPEHGSEQKRISNFVSGMGLGNVITCIQCNIISITHPHLIKYLVNKEDANKYSFGSNEKIPMNCVNCGYEKKLSFNKLVSRGFPCPRCSDGISYPEKFLFSFLEQLNLYFNFQLTKTTFKWCGKYKYDFYIEIINGIVEAGGLQHYDDTKGRNWGASLEEIQENDFDKEWIARINKIKNYIILDCRYSDMKWIKQSIMKSRLLILGFKEEDIDWLKCHEAGCNSLVKISCDLWNNGMKNTSQIADIIKVHRATIVNYLKQGVKLEWCDYDPKIAMTGNYSRSVICITTREIFNSIAEAGNVYKTDCSSISKCSKNKKKYSGLHSETGDKLKWMYLVDYENMVKYQNNNKPS